MEASAGPVKVTILNCKRAPDLAVSICVPFVSCKHCLTQLMVSTPGQSCELSHASALLFAIFSNVRARVMSSPLELSKVKISHMSCSGGDHFTLEWNTQGSFTSLRKTCTKAIKQMTTSGAYSKYNDAIRILGGKPDRDEFDALCAAFVGSLKNVSVVAVGKININEEKTKLIAEAVAKKVPQLKAGSHKALKGHKPCQLEYPALKASNLDALVLADFISSKLKSPVEVYPGLVYVINKHFESKKASLAAGIDDYAKKYEKLEENLKPVLAYIGLSRYILDCEAMRKIIKASVTPKSLETILRHHL